MIFGNVASYRGAGVYAYYCDPLLLNNTIVRNRCRYLGPTTAGAGIHAWRFGSSIRGVNNIIWGNEATFDHNYHGDVTLDYTLSHPLPPGTGNIDANPGFVDLAGFDFHLTLASPCRDSGDNGSVPSDLFVDFEGDPRIADGLVDMGADEFYAHLYSVGDHVRGSRVEIRIIGKPSASPTRLWIGDKLLDPPLPTPLGDFFVGAPRSAFGCKPLLPLFGVRSLSAGIPPGIAPGIYYLQAFTGRRLTNVHVVAVE